MHSPAPWTIIQSSGKLAIWDATQAPVAYPAMGPESNPEDAKLMAAAPDLLEALQLVLDRATMPLFLINKVKDAIAKATS